MSQFSDDVRVVFGWAESSCRLIIDAVQALRNIRSGLQRNKPGGTLIGMADDPKDLQDAVLAILKHNANFPDEYWYLIDLLQERFAEYLQPIRCPEYFCLSAVEAVRCWLDEVGDVFQRPLIWQEHAENIFESRAPNWAFQALSSKDHRDCLKSCEHALRRCKHLTILRVQWMRTHVDRERLMVSSLLDEFNEEPPAAKLVTVKQIAKMIHMSPKSITTAMKDKWPSPIVSKGGSRPAQWRLEELLPVLRHDFPDAFPTPSG